MQHLVIGKFPCIWLEQSRSERPLLQLLQAYGNNSHSSNGRQVYFVIEGNVNPRDAEERGLSIVYPNPQPSNFSYAKERHATLRARLGVLWHLVLALSAALNYSPHLTYYFKSFCQNKAKLRRRRHITINIGKSKKWWVINYILLKTLIHFDHVSAWAVCWILPKGV